MAEKTNIPQVRFTGFDKEWEKQKFDDILEKYEDPVATPHDGYERLGVRSHAKGTFHGYVAPGAELEAAQMHRVAANKLLFNITFAWEHAVAITDEADAGKLVSHRFPQFSLAPEMDPTFFRYVVADEKFRYHLWLSSPGGAGRNRVLNIPEMMEYQTYLPEKREQSCIADWFLDLDDLLKQHQFKLEKLQSLRLSMLEKLFPRTGADVPEVRFKEFSGPWENHPLYYYLEPSSEKNSQNYYTKEDVLSVSGEFGVVNQIKHLGRSYSGNIVKGYGIVKNGDVVYTKSPLKEAPYGIIKTNLGDSGIVSALYAVYHPKEDVYSPFVQTYFELGHRLNNYLRPIISKGAKNTINVSDESALLGTVCFPSYEEQKAISNYFSTLSTVILQTTQEIEKLKSLKKALLEKMFV